MKTSNVPWKCIHCRQLRKHNVTHCPTCHAPWQTAMDRTYVHGVKQNQQNWGGYPAGNFYYQDHQQPRQRSQSPRQRAQSPRGRKSPRNKGGGKGIDQYSFAPFPQFPHGPFFSTTGSTDGTAFAPTIDSTTMDAVTGAYGPHDAHAHAGPTNGKQCSDASANAHACAYVAAQCTGTGTEGAHCLPSEALCRPSPRHPAEGAQHLQEGREASHQRPRDGCQSTWRGAHSVRGGALGALTAYQHLEGILGRGGQELVRLWQAIRAARRGTTSQDSYGQGTVSGCQGVHGSFQHCSWESSGARAQRRRGPAWGRRGECDADHREHPIAFDLSPTALQGHRIDSDRREGGKTPAIGRIKRGSRSCLAFQLGWLWTTLWCHSRQPDVSDFPATQALKWSHSIMRESTFLCECGAREKAQKLALEIALSCHQVAPSGHFALPPTKKLKSSLHVGFAESTELHIWFEGDIQAQIFCLPADFFDGKSTPWSGCPMVADMKLSRFQVCPWHDGGLVRSCEPLNAQHSRITAPKKVISQYKITDHHFDNPARRLHQEDQQKNLIRT